MTINQPFCTLTGVDTNTDINKLWELSEKYPFVEFGVLLHCTNQGSDINRRYPTFEYIRELGSKIKSENDPNFALHICGPQAIKDFMDINSEVYKLSIPFKRIQLNFISEKYDINEIRKLFERESKKIIITQYNNANMKLWRKLSDFNNHNVLFDSSGGRGTEIQNICSPLDIESEGLPFKAINPLCGYAGGISEDNVTEILNKIMKVTNNNNFWIDMEQKLRDKKDNLDLLICEKVLEKVDFFMKNNFTKIVKNTSIPGKLK